MYYSLLVLISLISHDILHSFLINGIINDTFLGEDSNVSLLWFNEFEMTSIHLCLKLDAGLTPRVLPSDETWIHIFCNLIFDANVPCC